MNGCAIRPYLETEIAWLSNDEIEQYMAEHQHAPNAYELWLYFQNVIAWVRLVFLKYRKEMKEVAFVPLYNEFKEQSVGNRLDFLQWGTVKSDTLRQ